MSYRNQLRCRCPRCTIRALMGPAVLVTIGILFLLQEMRGGYLDFGNTYPVILIVIGIVKIVESLQKKNSGAPPEDPSGKAGL